jgi:hypothetical protein
MQRNLPKILFSPKKTNVLRSIFKVAPYLLKGAIFYFSFFTPLYANTIENKTLNNSVKGLTVNTYVSNFELTTRDTSRYNFSRIEEKASKYYITRKLFGLFIQDNSKTRLDSILHSHKATDKYNHYNNKIIRSITISSLPPFGTSAFDSTLKPSTRIEKVANKLHINTLDLTIKNSLLQEVGEKVSPHLLVESEDLLRKLPYINDINIIISPSERDTTFVDLLVIVKDKWTIGSEIKFSNSKIGLLELFDKNIAGSGVELLGQMYYDYNSIEYGHGLKVISRNPLGYGIVSGFGIRKGLGYNNTNASIEKSFATIKSKWAGGVEFNRNAEPFFLKLTDSLTSVSYQKWNGWLGYSFTIKSFLTSPAQLAFTFSQVNTKYYQRPSASINSNYLFHNGNIYLLGATVANHIIYRNNHVYEYGTTEDIPNGFMVSTTGGFERYEYSNRPYFAMELSGARSTSFGYLNSTLKTGGFYNSGAIEQGVIKFENSYFTNIFWYSNWFFRFFANINFTKGINRKYGEGEYLYIKSMPTTPSPLVLSGRERLNLKTQLVAFSPLSIYGFKFALFNFTDCITINTSEGLFKRNGLVLGIGAGIRIRNDNLVFQTFQLQFGYYPILPKGEQLFNYDIGNTTVGSLGDFRPKKPSVIGFE